MHEAGSRFKARVAALAAMGLVAVSLDGCSSSSNPGPSCASAQTLSVAGFTTGAAAYSGPGYVTSPQPYSSSATFIYFSASGGPVQTNAVEPYTVTGEPVLKGSDGSTLTGGALTPETITHDGSTTLAGYSSSISNLAPDVTYSVPFASLGAGLNSCRYTGESAGSFLTD